MARLYANENFALPVIEALRRAGHDVLTSHEAGNAGRAVPDNRVLAYAIENDRAILTFNRRHFIKLHASVAQHFGIIVCTFDSDFGALAGRINATITQIPDMRNQLVRINRAAN